MKMSLLLRGAIVKVKPLEWFIDNYVFLKDPYSLDSGDYTNGYFESSDHVFMFTLEMQKFCGKTVTISRSSFSKKKSSIAYKILEDNEKYYWSIDMFDNIISYEELLESIKCYCNSSCIFGIESCNEDCPLNKVIKVVNGD